MICRKKNSESSGDFRSNLDPEVPFFSMDSFPWEYRKAPCPPEPSCNLPASLSPSLNYCRFLLLFQGLASSWEKSFHKRGTERHQAVTEAPEKSIPFCSFWQAGRPLSMTVSLPCQDTRLAKPPVASHTRVGFHAHNSTDSLKEIVNRSPCLGGNLFPLQSS